MRRTKIISTLGPASESPEMLRRLLKAGVDIFRLNMSHATHEWVEKVVQDIRAASRDVNRPVGIMIDTQGPEIRTGNLSAKLDLKPGDHFVFTVRGAVSEEERSVDVNYDGLVSDISVGDVVLVDSGVIRMKVLSKEGNHLRCEVLTPGTMGSRRHINLPGVRVNLPALTEHDREAVRLAMRLGIEFIALSFVRDARDVRELLELLASEPHPHIIRIIAKIEDQLALKNLDEIIDVADGLMVARGDLGIENPYEELPGIQRRIVRACLERVRPVIVATHMLESMIQNPIPTRAEVTDVSNAVFEQADAIMLSGETSVGRYPVECVETMHKIARRTEMAPGAGFASSLPLNSPRDAMVECAVHLANNLQAAALLVFTKQGRIASLCAAMRPNYSPIFAFTPVEDLVNRLTLRWGVTPILMQFSDNREETVSAAVHKLHMKGLVKKSDQLVVLSDIVAGDEIVDSVQIRIVR